MSICKQRHLLYVQVIVILRASQSSSWLLDYPLCANANEQRESCVNGRMQRTEKQTMAGTIQSFFRSSSIKKRKIAQAVSVFNDLSERAEPAESFPSLSTEQSPVLESASETSSSQLESGNVLSSSAFQSSQSSAVNLQPTSNPVDISRSGSDPPAQPKLSLYKKNKENRSFQSQWFSSFPWLEYSKEQDSAFCFYCRHFSSHVHRQMRVSNFGLSESDVHSARILPQRLELVNAFSDLVFLLQIQSDSFTIGGFQNWRKALIKGYGFQKHEICISHIQATTNYQQYVTRSTNQTTVRDVLDRGRVEQIRKNRQRLVKIASALLFCAKQMISFRGHDETEKWAMQENCSIPYKWNNPPSVD